MDRSENVDASPVANGRDQASSEERGLCCDNDQGPDSIVVYWTSRDADVAKELVFPYVLNSKLRGWWEDVTLVVWGPSQKTLCESKELQEYLETIREAGVKLEACKACSDNYGISDQLTELGIEVKYMGLLTTQYIKSGRKVLTF